MTRLGSFEENTKVVKGKLHKFTARNGLSTSTACNEINQMVLLPRLVFTQAMLLLPLSSWTLTGVCYLYLLEQVFLYDFSRRAILERKDRKKSSAAGGDVEMADVSSLVY